MGTDLVAPFLSLVSELRGEAVGPALPRGPTLSDSLYAKILASFILSLPEDPRDRGERVKDYFSTHQELGAWLQKRLAEEPNRLKMLVRMELRKKESLSRTRALPH